MITIANCTTDTSTIFNEWDIKKGVVKYENKYGLIHTILARESN